jgi:hypothetical protein
MGLAIRGEASSILGGFWIKVATGPLVRVELPTYGRIIGYLTKMVLKFGVGPTIINTSHGSRIS